MSTSGSTSRAQTGGAVGAWVETAPDELLDELPSLDRFMIENVDCLIAVQAPENTRETSAVPPERMAKLNVAYRPAMERVVSGNLAWVGCQYPTPALAQEAGMSFREFEDFLYGACLIDWDAERERMQAVKDRLDAADEIRIVGADTDVTLRPRGPGRDGRCRRRQHPRRRGLLLPGGGLGRRRGRFLGVPGRLRGARATENIRSASRTAWSSTHRQTAKRRFFNEVLDRDEGARRLGELGLGCNPGITRYMRNTLFDEKINGTVHLALGQGFDFLGGTNESNVHWDIVKDLRDGGRIYADGELVLENGDWRI